MRGGARSVRSVGLAAMLLIAATQGCGPASVATPSSAASLLAPPTVEAPPTATPLEAAAIPDVTMYRVDAQRSGVQPGPVPHTTPVLVWSRTADAGIGLHPVLADGVLYVGSDDGRLYALDARTGDELWRYDAGSALQGSAAIANGMLFASSEDGTLHAIDLATHRRAWQTMGVEDVGLVADGIVYVADSADRAVGYDATDGTERWSWTAPGAVQRLTVADGTAYVTVAGGTLHAIALADGAARWPAVQTLSNEAGFPLLTPDRVVLSTIQNPGEPVGQVLFIDRASGAIVSQFRSPSGQQVSASAIVDGTLYAPTQGDGTYALRVADGTTIWHQPVEGDGFTPAALADGLLVEPVEGPHGIVALRSTDGEPAWSIPWMAEPSVWLVASGGYVFGADANGGIHAYADQATVGAAGPAIASVPLGTPSPNESRPAAVPDPFHVVERLDAAVTGVRRAAGIAVSPTTGNLFVLDRRPAVSVIAPDGRLVDTWGARGAGDGEFDFTYPAGQGGPAIAVGPDGLVYVADVGNGRVQVFQPDGTFVRKFGSFGAGGGQFIRPYQLNADADGNVYVLDSGSFTLSKFDRDGAFMARFGSGAGGLAGSQALDHGVAIDGESRLVLTDDAAAQVLTLDRDGRLLDVFGERGLALGQFQAPCAVKVDRDDNIYVYDCETNLVQVFDRDHRLLGASGPGQGIELEGWYDFGPDGRLYAIGADDSILVIEVSLLTR
jgi:outer membrane protein assembly factor BamB